MQPNVRDENRSIVVPAISAPSSVACLRSLGRRGIGTVAVSSDESTPAFRSAYCDESVLVPAPDENLLAYKDALLALAERPDVATIIPVREADIYVLSKYREAFSEHVATPWPDLETLARVQDRAQLFEAAAEAGVGAPETRLLAADADPDRRWIVKPRYSILTEEYAEDLSPADFVAPPSTRYLPPGEAPDVGAIEAEMGHVPICQEYVPTTDEYGFFALYDHGEPVATFQHRQRRGWSYAGGPSAFRESVNDPALERAGRDLLDHLEWHGLAMVEFLRDETTGEFGLMEINPRFWSSLPFSVQTGADFPHYYWQLATGRREEIDHDYEVGVAGHLLRGELLHLHSVLTDEYELVERPRFAEAAWEIGRSIVAHPRFDYLRADDLRPFVRDALNTLEAFHEQEDAASVIEKSRERVTEQATQ